MPRKTSKTKNEIIEELEKLNFMYVQDLEKAYKVNGELMEAEEGTFLHSPTYIQMKEQIEFLKNLNGVMEYTIASAKKRVKKIDPIIEKIYEDNKRLTSEKAGMDYFIGITENWHKAQDYQEKEEEIWRLSAEIEQKKQAIADRDAEIYRLQMLLGEKILREQQQEPDRSDHIEESISNQQNSKNITVPRRRGR